MSTEFVTLLAQILARQGNRIGAILYSDRVDAVIPACSGRRHVLHVLHRILSRPELTHSAPTDVNHLLQTALRVVRRRSIVFVVSDFISLPGWTKPLAQLAQRHDVVAVRLCDPLETELPDLGLLTVQDTETGAQLFVDTSDKAFRKRFAEAVEQRAAALRMALGRAGVDALELSTQDDLVEPILRFADLRKQHSRLVGPGGRPRHIESAA